MPFSKNMKHGLKISGGMEGDTIAINELGKQFVTFDATKLQECKKVATIHICTNIDSTWSIQSLTESCLGSIYKLETDLITKNCPTTPVKLKNTVKKLSPNTWLLFSPSSEKVTWRCSGTKSEELSIYRYKMLK